MPVVFMLTQSEKEAIFDHFVHGSVTDKNDAIQAIYEEFQPVMYKKLRYQFQHISESEAQDIVQEAFIKLATTTSMPKSAGSIVSWVFTIAENTALDLFKKAYKKYEIPMPEELDDSFGNQLTINESDLAANFNVQDCVLKGIIEFSFKFPKNAAVVSMSLDEMAIIEIAQVISRSESATKQYIYESKKKLAPYIQHCLES
jgi:RNA polymerase sigma-70 factor (ECF subfamily)